MANRLIKLAKVTYIPAVAGVVGHNGYWATPGAISAGKGEGSGLAGGSSPANNYGSNFEETYRLAVRIYEQALGTTYRSDSNSQFSNISKAASNTMAAILEAIAGSGPSSGNWGYGAPIRIYVPPVKSVSAVAARTIHDPQSGWNGGGRSINRFRHDGQVMFQFGPRSSGVLAGLAGPDDSRNFSEATHAFYLLSGHVRIVESGIVVATLPDIWLMDSPVFTITRIGTVVTYTVGTFSYTSAKPSSGDVYLDVLLYTADDYVDNPVLNVLQSGRAVEPLVLDGGFDLRPRAAAALTLAAHAIGRSNGVTRIAARGDVQLGGLASGSARHAGRGATEWVLEGQVMAAQGRSIMRAPRPRMISSELAYARSVARHGGYGIDSSGGMPVIAVASSVAMHTPARVRSEGITGGTGASVAAHRSGGAYSIDTVLTVDGGWGRSSAVKAGHYLTISGAERYGPQEFVINEALVLFGAQDIGSWQNLGVDEWLQLQIEADVLVMVEAGVSELLMLSDSASVLYDLELAISDALYLSSGGATRADGGLQVAVNMTTAASSFYRNFDYLAIHSLDSIAYGVKANGIYRLGVGLGGAMDAEIDFGETDFGGAATSRIETIFLGCSADGEVYIKLTPDDGNEHTYRVIQRQPIMRANPARGLNGRKWRLHLQLAEVTAAEVDMIQFIGAGSQRRGRH